MNSAEVGYDCEVACICNGDLSLCPNIQAFGTMALELATQTVRRHAQEVESPQEQGQNN